MIRGMVFVGFAIFFGLHWWLLPAVELSRRVPMFFAAVSMSAMALCFVLAARWRFMEGITRGLDKSYKLHRWLGVLAVLALYLHAALEPSAAGLAQFPTIAEFGEISGEIAQWVFLLAVGISVLRCVPYHWWRFTHHLMGPAFAVAVVHTFVADSPMVVGSPVWLWMWLVSALGLGAWCSNLVKLFDRLPNYRVARIRALNGAGHEIVLQPMGRALSHRPGQFAFVSFQQPGFEEPHPFTIASDNPHKVRLIVREIGDYTRFMGALREGVKACVEGPYGRFVYRHKVRRQIWIAGGVGVTPFLAFLERLPKQTQNHIDLVLCAPSYRALIALDEIKAFERRTPNLHVHLCLSDKQQRMSIDWLKSHFGDTLTSAHIWFCGPPGLRDLLKCGMAELGIPQRRFHYEHFDIRNPPLRLGWLLKQALWALRFMYRKMRCYAVHRLQLRRLPAPKLRHPT